MHPSTNPDSLLRSHKSLIHLAFNMIALSSFGKAFKCYVVRRKPHLFSERSYGVHVDGKSPSGESIPTARIYRPVSFSELLRFRFLILSTSVIVLSNALSLRSWAILWPRFTYRFGTNKVPFSSAGTYKE